MRFSIMFKSTAVLIFCILVGALVIFLTSQYFVSNGFDRSFHQELQTMRHIVDDTYANQKKMLSHQAKMLSHMVTLAQAYRSGEASAFKRFAEQKLRECQVDFLILFDNKGTVLARGHSHDKGDSFANVDIVRVALGGSAFSEALNLKKGGLSVGAAAPVFVDGSQVGVVLLGNLFSTHALVDEIKKVTGLEMTIFSEDTRISTSLQRNGARAVGTKLNNETIFNTVLRGGRAYAAPATIFGKEYRTVYWPIKESSGKILGMWFIGTSVENVERTSNEITQYSLLATALVVLLLSILGYLYFRNLVMPLKKTVDYAKDISNGNLDVDLVVPPRKDEIGELVEALQGMVSSLKEKIADADRATGQAEEATKKAEAATREAEEAAREAHEARREGMHAAAEQLERVVVGISAAASELSSQIEESDQGAKESSERLDEATAAMVQMNAAVQDVAKNASLASNVSGEARANAEEGQRILTMALESITRVRDVSFELQQGMGELHEHAKNITQIMSVISDIADQTNLLALNAAIEAARAGDAGRGFAVVADEVRKLAEKTMSSTGDVANAINAIQGSTQRSLDKMNEALEAVEAATGMAKQSGDALSKIVENVEATADQVKSIAAAAVEQSASSGEISKLVESVNEMSAQTARAMDEAAQAISDLASQTESLSALVKRMEKE
ncbi:MAG: cache domain-containing protein [Desulfovibrionaceae bacterium]|nr:cache domain-containing protein [Desulfovibrionaceae bacterium]